MEEFINALRKNSNKPALGLLWVDEETSYCYANGTNRELANMIANLLLDDEVLFALTLREIGDSFKES